MSDDATMKSSAIRLITEVPGYFARFGFRMIDREQTPMLIQGSVEFASVCPETAPVMSVPLDALPSATRGEVRNRYGSIARELILIYLQRKPHRLEHILDVIHEASREQGQLEVIHNAVSNMRTQVKL